MKSEFVVEIALETTTAEECPDSMNSGADFHVDRRSVSATAEAVARFDAGYAVCMTRVTAAATRFQ